MTRKPKYLHVNKDTFEYAKEESRKRQKTLRIHGSKPATALATILKNCKKHSRCGSTSCPVCSKRFGKKIDQAIGAFIKANPKTFGKNRDCMATIIPRDALMGARALKQYNVARRHNTIGRQFSRSDLADVVGIGITEVAFKRKWEKVCVHEHIIVFSRDKEDFAKLRKLYKGHIEGIREFRIDPIDPGTLSKVISYCFKFTTYGTNKFGRQKQRPPVEAEAEMLIFLHRHKFTDLMYLKGVRYAGGRFTLLHQR